MTWRDLSHTNFMRARPSGVMPLSALIFEVRRLRELGRVYRYGSVCLFTALQVFCLGRVDFQAV